jgi:hypothetical protein
MNLCAEIQIDLARLRIFTHRFTNLLRLEDSEAEAAMQIYQNACDRLGPTLETDGDMQTWVYPELLRSIVNALTAFPLSEVVKCTSQGSSDVERILVTSRQREIETLSELAEHLEKKRVTAPLLDLARYVHSVVRKGARTDEPIYEQIARIIADGKYFYEVQKQFNTWAQDTQSLVNISAVGLLHVLINHCRRLKPAQEILADLLARMESLSYVPFVFDGLGIALPVSIEGDFDKQSNEPLVLGFESPDVASIGKEFSAAIKRGRDRAVEMLKRRGLMPALSEFHVKVTLPDLGIMYDQGSIEFPVAISLFCQHPPPVQFGNSKSSNSRHRTDHL